MQLFVKAFIALKHLHKQLTHGTEMAVTFYLLEKKKKKKNDGNSYILIFTILYCFVYSSEIITS